MAPKPIVKPRQRRTRFAKSITSAPRSRCGDCGASGGGPMEAWGSASAAVSADGDDSAFSTNKRSEAMAATVDGTSRSCGDAASVVDVESGLCAASASAGAVSGLTSFLILSQSSAGGSTASTMTLSSPSRRSHCRTAASKPGSNDSNASACSRSSAERVPSTYSAARVSWSSSNMASQAPPSRSHACADLEQAATQPRLDCVHGNIELLRELIAAPAAVIGGQHGALLFRVELAEAREQPFELFVHLASGKRRRRVGGDVERIRLIFDRHLALLAYDIDGPIARDRHHPGDWAGDGRIELGGHLPHLEIGFLHDLIGQFRPTQDTQKHPVQFRTGGAIELLEGGSVTLGDGRKQFNQFRLRQHHCPRHPHRASPWSVASGALTRRLDYRRGSRLSSR